MDPHTVSTIAAFISVLNVLLAFWNLRNALKISKLAQENLRIITSLSKE